MANVDNFQHCEKYTDQNEPVWNMLTHVLSAHLRYGICV
jgi:hypothetical protein